MEWLQGDKITADGFAIFTLFGKKRRHSGRITYLIRAFCFQKRGSVRLWDKASSNRSSDPSWMSFLPRRYFNLVFFLHLMSLFPIWLPPTFLHPRLPVSSFLNECDCGLISPKHLFSTCAQSPPLKTDAVLHKHMSICSLYTFIFIFLSI